MSDSSSGDCSPPANASRRNLRQTNLNEQFAKKRNPGAPSPVKPRTVFIQLPTPDPLQHKRKAPKQGGAKRQRRNSQKSETSKRQRPAAASTSGFTLKELIDEELQREISEAQQVEAEMARLGQRHAKDMDMLRVLNVYVACDCVAH
eukprot:c1849_g1_i1.p1 GENE.c1849_g1_i1~~c1849_g1_i1.p1  ORF type:complete len:147 (-),score=20.02 c1849_g1_i1:297-737(-)